MKITLGKVSRGLMELVSCTGEEQALYFLVLYHPWLKKLHLKTASWNIASVVIGQTVTRNKARRQRVLWFYPGEWGDEHWENVEWYLKNALGPKRENQSKEASLKEETILEKRTWKKPGFFTLRISQMHHDGAGFIHCANDAAINWWKAWHRNLTDIGHNWQKSYWILYARSIWIWMILCNRLLLNAT